MRGCINKVQTLFREIFPQVGSNLEVLECQVLFGVSLCFMCFSWLPGTAHYAPIEVHVSGILGRRGWRVNQTLVKVMFQWKEPTMAVLIPPPPPRSDPIPWLVGLWWERTRGPACSYTQPGIRQPRAPGLSAN